MMALDQWILNDKRIRDIDTTMKAVGHSGWESDELVYFLYQDWLDVIAELRGFVKEHRGFVKEKPCQGSE